MKLYVIIALIILPLIAISAAELVPIYPLNYRDSDRKHISQPDTSLDWWMTHVDENAEYYLGSGAENDTFFMVFEIPYACSIHFAEFQWFDAGIVDFFVALYSDEAEELFPDGCAPDRGTSPVSPIGEWLTDLTSITAAGYGDWELAEIEPNLFSPSVPYEQTFIGIGFIKTSMDSFPHPLADRMDSKSIRYTYTWFGGPWMPNHGFDETWGAYSSDIQNDTVVEVMARIWIWGWGPMPILISNLSEQSNTYNQTGPFQITCNLDDNDPGITEEDSIALCYKVNGGEEIRVQLEELEPIGADIYGGNIEGSFSTGDSISYWIYAENEIGLESMTFPESFRVLTPENPGTDLLLITNSTDDNRELTYFQTLNSLGYYYESWNLHENNGIDESVVYWGWDNIIIAGWGIDVLDPGDDPNPFLDFLDNGGNLCLIDQDWFYASNLEPEGSFEPGDFAYDYFGIGYYYNDPPIPQTTYVGVQDDPITGLFSEDFYETFWDGGIHMEPENLWADHFILHTGNVLFWGLEISDVFGVRNQIGDSKTIFLSFMAEASCEFYNDSVAVSEDFETLISNICEWFEVPYTGVGTHSAQTVADFTLYSNHPNPFNAETTITFFLPSQSEIEVSIFNIEGKLVETLFSGMKAAGVHSVRWNAGDLASGIYICRVELQSAGTHQHNEAVQKLLLLK